MIELEKKARSLTFEILQIDQADLVFESLGFRLITYLVDNYDIVGLKLSSYMKQTIK